MIPGAGSLPLVEAAIIEEREWPTRELPANPASLDSDDCVIPLSVSESPFVLPAFSPFFFTDSARLAFIVKDCAI